MDCWSELGLTAQAGVRDVKRQYARRLKDTRPDDDPLGFQHLREAYEQALARAQWREQHAERGGVAVAPEVPERASESPVSAERDVDMPETFSPEAFQRSLERAKAQGRRERFEQRLLYLLLDASEEDLGGVYWAMEHLHWYSPWQPAHLPQEDLNRLAERLLIGRLRFIHGQLCAGEEQASLQMIGALGEEGWLSSLDRRDWFQQRLAEMLVEAPGWSHLFFEQVCRLYGWSDEIGSSLPFAEALWRQLLSRCEEGAMAERLFAAAESRTCKTPEQKAARFLFGKMGPGSRRYLVDRFTQAEWSECYRLSNLLESRFPQLRERLAEEGPENWRQWLPCPSWVGLYLLVWAGGLLCYLGHSLGKDYTDSSARLSELGIFVFMSLLAMVTLAPWLAKAWWLLAHLLAWPDTWLSNGVIPRRWFREGAGLLLVRHVLPNVAYGGVVWLSLSDALPAALALAVSVLWPLLTLAYLNHRLSRNEQPTLWQRLASRFPRIRVQRRVRAPDEPRARRRELLWILGSIVLVRGLLALKKHYGF
ncbi:hypothetical protein [Pseudomonas sp.]|uniref:hypothetical protein n=1 Tax=Pseudomonas sp. TaxID=306 RepID=UPI0028B0A43B|nr:hypothetical protein [Pseudomonas sp.]